MTTQVLIVAGQSNALGFQITGAELPSWYAPDARVQIWTATGWQTMEPGVNCGIKHQLGAWGPEVGYAAAWLADPANAGQTLYVVKHTDGGIGLAANPGAVDWSPSSVGEMFDGATAKVAAAKATLTGPFHTTALWFQGEQDATNATDAGNYATNLAGLQSAAATSWGVDDFQYGRISTGLAYNDVVQAAQSAGFDTDHEPKQADGLHFTGAAQIDHGAEFYAQASSVVTVNMTGGVSDERYVGGKFADSIAGGAGNDAMYGGPGDDWLHGNVGDDSLSGGAGNDMIYGGQGNDRVFLSDGDDWVHVNLGDDVAYGGAGADVFYGGQGHDSLHGDAGNDWLSGDKGNDVLTGGAGADTFRFVASPGDHDTVTDFSYADGDRVQLEPGETYTATQVGADVLVTLGGGLDITLTGVNLASLGAGWII